MRQSNSNPSSLKRFVQSSILRLFLIPITGVVSLSTAHLITKFYGVNGYGQIAVIISLSSFLSIAELGLGASVVNHAANASSIQSEFSSVFHRSFKLIFLASSGLILIIIVLSQSNLLARVLNLSKSGISTPALTTALLILVIGIPCRLGYYLLMASGRNLLVIVLQTMPALILLSVTFVGGEFHYSISTLVMLSTLGISVANFLSLLLARNIIPLKIKDNLRKTKLRTSALPYFLTTTFTIIPLRVTPIFLNWSSTLREVSLFAAISSFYQPASSVIQAASPSLWAEFARKRESNENSKHFLRQALILSSILGVLGAIALFTLGPIMTRQFINPHLVGSVKLYLVFSVLLMMGGLTYPIGIFLTSPEGLRFQAVCTGLVATFFVIIFFSLGSRYGALGAATSFLLATVLFQFVPFLTRVVKILNLP